MQFNDDQLESASYRRLRTWYLARLRRAHLADRGSLALNPSTLMEADSKRLNEVSSLDAGLTAQDASCKTIMVQYARILAVAGLLVPILSCAFAFAVSYINGWHLNLGIETCVFAFILLAVLGFDALVWKKTIDAISNS